MDGLAWARSLDLNGWVGLGSAALALASFLLNWAVVSRQSALQVENLKAKTDAHVLAWAEEAVEALCAAHALARGRGVVYDEDDLRRRAHETVATLSALAERGRLAFPNLDLAGQDRSRERGGRERAFQGVRPPVLDALVFAMYRLERMDLRNLGPDEAVAAFLVRCRRLFVAEVQRAVDPRRRGRMSMRLGSGGGGRAQRPGFREAGELGVVLEDLYPGLMSVKRDEVWVADMEKRAVRS